MHPRWIPIGALVCVVGGCVALGLGAQRDRLPRDPLASGVLVIGKVAPTRLQSVVEAMVPTARTVPMRFLGIYETPASKPHHRRYLVVCAATAAALKEAIGLNVSAPTVLLGDGVPETFNPTALAQWRPELRLPANAPVLRFKRQQRALKWTVIVVGRSPQTVGTPAWLICTPQVRRVTRALMFSRISAIGVSQRVPLRPPEAFWTAWIGWGLIFAGGHLSLWWLWRRWRGIAAVALLVREGWIYHFVALAYFALYLTAVGVIYNRPDFQDAMTIPPQWFSPQPPLRWLAGLPVMWVILWGIQMVTVMLPSALIPPAGVVIGHWRGMVEQALSTAPIAQGGFFSGLLTGLAVFWHGEMTIVAMVWSGLLTRAIIAPHTFGTDDYWQAYKTALRAFVPIVQIVGFLALFAAFFTTIAIVYG